MSSETGISDSPDLAEVGGSPEMDGRVPWLATLAGGLVAAGVLTAGVALTMEVRPARSDVPVWVLLGAVVVAGAVVALLAAGLRARRVRFRCRGEIHGSASGPPHDAGVVRRRLAIAGALLALLAAGYAGLEARVDLYAGLPTLMLPLLAGGLGLVAVGCVVAALLPIRPRSVVSTRSPAALKAAAIGAATALVGAGLALGAAETVRSWPIDSTTAEAAELRPVSEAPTSVSWTWTRPGERGLKTDDVVAAGPGVAIRLDDGVVALDGRTGKERWHYRRSGSVVKQIGASPGGEWVGVAFAPSTPDSDWLRVVVLDGRTGEVGFERVMEGGAFDRVRLEMTGEVVVAGDVDEGGISGIALQDGRTLWRWQRPGECRRSNDPAWAGAETVLVSMVCIDDLDGYELSGTVVAMGLDDRTGEEVWRHEAAFTTTLPEQSSGPDPDRLNLQSNVTLVPGHDGSAAMMRWHISAPDEPFHEVMLDTRSGEVLVDEDAALLDRGRVISYDRDGWLTISSEGSDVTSRRHTFATGHEETVLSPECTFTVSWVDAVDSLVELCTNTPVRSDGSEAHSVFVTPWATPDDRREIEVDLGPFSRDGVVDVARLIDLPSGIVVIQPGANRVVGLG